MGSGTTTSLWEDWWCGKDSFKARWGHNFNFPETTMVKEIINEKGTWDISKAIAMIPVVGVNGVLSTPLPLSNVIDKGDIPS